MGDADQAEQWLQRAEAIGAGQPFPIVARLRLLKYREQHDQARELAGKALAQNAEDRHGSQYVFRQTWAYESARVSDFQAALETYRESIAWAFEPDLNVPDDLATQTADVLQVAALIKLADPTSERPQKLLRAVENLSRQLPPSWGVWAGDLNNAAIATIRGEHEQALQWLNSAWDKKWRFRWREILVHDVIFSQLQNEPGYKDLIARFELDMEQQRQLAYELMEIQK